MIQMNLQNRKRLTHLISLTYGCLYTLLYLKWTTNKDLLHKTSMLCSSLNGRGVLRRMDTCMCMAESRCCSPEAITTLLIGYTSIQNKGFFFLILKKKNPCPLLSINRAWSIKVCSWNAGTLYYGSCISDQIWPIEYNLPQQFFNHFS